MVTLTYLADVFEKSNILHISSEEKNSNILETQGKVEALVKKLEFWKNRINREVAVDTVPSKMFSTFTKFITEDARKSDRGTVKCVVYTIEEHLSTLKTKFEDYFSKTDNEKWIRDPFSVKVNDKPELNMVYQDQLTELLSDKSLKRTCQKIALAIFWLSVQCEL